MSVHENGSKERPMANPKPRNLRPDAIDHKRSYTHERPEPDTDAPIRRQPMSDTPKRVRINTDAWQDDSPYGSRFTEAYDDTGHYDKSMPVYRRETVCVWKVNSALWPGCSERKGEDAPSVDYWELVYCPYCGGRIEMEVAPEQGETGGQHE
jgi:hypothetical protein